VASSKIKMVELSLFADYFQFYIQDEAAAGDLISELESGGN